MLADFLITKDSQVILSTWLVAAIWVFAASMLFQGVVAYLLERKAFARSALAPIEKAIGFVGPLQLWVGSIVSRFLNKVLLDDDSNLPGCERLVFNTRSSCSIDTKPSTIIVMVRGTFGAGGYDQRFYSLGDALAQVQRVHIWFYRWDGRNSELSRRKNGATLRDSIGTLIQRFPGVPIRVIGHSHGGSVAVHATRNMNKMWPVRVIALAAPVLQVEVRQLRDLGTFATAAIYAGGLMPAFVILTILAISLRITGHATLSDFISGGVLPLGLIAIVLLVFQKKRADAALEEFERILPAPSRPIHHVWCVGDEVFVLLAKAATAREAAWLQAKRFLHTTLKLDIPAFCWFFLLESLVSLFFVGLFIYVTRYGIRESPADFAVLFLPTVPAFATVTASALGGKLFFQYLVLRRPTRFHRVIGRIVLWFSILISAGITYIASARLFGLSLLESLQVKVKLADRIEEIGTDMREVTDVLVQGGWFFRLHGATVSSEAITKEVVRICSHA